MNQQRIIIIDTNIKTIKKYKTVTFTGISVLYET
jgi:hypothetical protein